MSEQKPGFKILEILVENFKNIPIKQIHVGGRSFWITGRNGAGKSSLIQAILSPLDSKYVPEKPIMEGEERGLVELIIGDGTTKYKLRLHFTPGKRTGTLRLYDEKGGELKPGPKIIDSILDFVAFDIVSFLKKSPEKQAQELKEISGVDFTELDKEYKDVYAKRTFLNGKTDEEEAQLKNHGYTKEQLDKYSSPVDEKDLRSKMTELAPALEAWMKTDQKLTDLEKSVDTMTLHIAGTVNKIDETKQHIENKLAEIEKIKEEIERSKTYLDDLGAQKENQLIEKNKTIERIENGKTWRANNPKPNASEIQQKLAAAEEHNREHLKVAGFALKNQNVHKWKGESEDFSKRLKEIGEEKKLMIKNSKLPIDDISFDEDGVYYKGLPLTDKQINKSKRIEIGMRIDVARNPKLRVAFIEDASLFDPDHRQELVKIAEQFNIQLIGELVTGSDSELGEEFIESDITNN